MKTLLQPAYIHLIMEQQQLNSEMDFKKIIIIWSDEPLKDIIVHDV